MSEETVPQTNDNITWRRSLLNNLICFHPLPLFSGCFEAAAGALSREEAMYHMDKALYGRLLRRWAPSAKTQGLCRLEQQF